MENKNDFRNTIVSFFHLAEIRNTFILFFILIIGGCFHHSKLNSTIIRKVNAPDLMKANDKMIYEKETIGALKKIYVINDKD